MGRTGGVKSAVYQRSGHDLMLIVPAHAKVNLALDVVTRRPDGWHDIDSVLTPIDWHDLVGVWLRAAERTTVRLRVTGPASNGVPEGDANLAVRYSGMDATLGLAFALVFAGRVVLGRPRAQRPGSYGEG